MSLAVAPGPKLRLPMLRTRVAMPSIVQKRVVVKICCNRRNCCCRPISCHKEHHCLQGMHDIPLCSWLCMTNVMLVFVLVAV